MVVIKSRRPSAEIHKNSRQLMQLPARIDPGQGVQLLRCVVSDLSDNSAGITLANDAKLPEEFVIVLSADGRVRRRCRTVWRNGLELGVQLLPDSPENSVTIVALDV